MKLPFELVVRGATLPPAIRHEITALASRLDHFCGRVMRCRVTVEGPGPHHAQGRWALRIVLTVPDRKIVVTRQKGEDLGEALREAFAAATRRLEDYVRRGRGFVKTPSKARRGRVVEIFPAKGYGFIQDEEGREIYFHANSILNCDFKRLGVGARVRFSEEAGEKGPQASTVATIRGRRPPSSNR